ncbi:DUF3373 domain-containing protein [Seleniivibrio woodruffii]|uniref:Uncharacterized protein DUF3373 n=1 Tax=Seleniivibrio woodruffii TaxID=1078050 RepID=A0A4R1KAG6_9BACT|nr:DUF3373 domain-containing protein [Seleniivibrio woodruffii]TCK61030.1 uncharacterized protein DUF3373 [Seleniivibrio woodruffii]TVZ36660.1 uncharacterized protein DUF3373 [Seleniivibrio woodruffii]
MRKALLFILLTLFAASAYAADVTLEELKSQISALQEQVNTMSKSVDKNEVHRIKDKVDMGIELRTKMDSISYDDVRALPGFANDMMGLWMRGYMINDSGAATAWDQYNMQGGNTPDGFNDAWVATYGNEFMAFMQNLVTQPDIQAMMQTPEMQTWFGTNMAAIGAAGTAAGFDMTSMQGQYMAGLMYFMYEMMSGTTVTAQQAQMMKTMFKHIEPRKYSTNNDSIFTNKLRIRMNSTVNENLSFTGRLVMYKTWSDATDVRWMDGTYKSMYMDGNAGAVPTDDKLHVERAYFVYKNDMGPIPYHFSFGRRPSNYGPGEELRNNATLGGSPLSHIIQWQFDGASLQFDFENVAEFLPGSFIKFCYGKGYESGWGSSNAMSANNGLIATMPVDDVEFFGTIVKFYDDDTYKFWYNYAKGFGVTDGFTGSVVMPFAIVGHDYNLDKEYDAFEFAPNYFGSSSRMEATTEMGDMEWHSFLAQGKTLGFEWFASYSTSKTDPKNISQNAMYQFMDMDKMLGSMSAKNGHSYWLGISTPELPFTGGKLGFEYNHGSKYWVAMTGAEDDIVGSKLAVRGDVFEVYYHQPIVGDRLFATIGYQLFDYEYSGSGSYLGAPVKVSEVNGLNAMMPVTDKVEKIYASFTYRY